jgi:hypothetical protein
VGKAEGEGEGGISSGITLRGVEGEGVGGGTSVAVTFFISCLSCASISLSLADATCALALGVVVAC